MADYRDLLRRAIEALPENNGNARRQVYDKARAALRKQLDAIQPELASREKTHHRLQLEECIREVEQEATERMLSGLSGLSQFEQDETATPDRAETSDAAPAKSDDETRHSHPEAETDAPRQPKSTSQDETAEPALATAAASMLEPAEPVRAPHAETQAPDEAVSGADADEGLTEPEPVSDTQADNGHETSALAEAMRSSQLSESQSKIEKSAFAWFRSRHKPADTAPVETIVEALKTDAGESDAGESGAGESGKVDEAPQVELDTSASQAKTIETPRLSSGATKTDSADETVPSPLANEPAMSAETEVELDADAGSRTADPQMAIDHAIAVLDRAASGDDAGDGSDVDAVEQADGETGFARAEAEDEGGGSPALTIFLVLVLLLLAGAGGASYWAWREGYLDLSNISGSETVAVSQTTSPASEANPATPATPARNVTTTIESDSASEGDSRPGNTAAAPGIVETTQTGLEQAGASSDSSEALALAAAEAASGVPTATMDGSDSIAGAGNTTSSGSNDATDAAAIVAEPETGEDKIDERLPVASDTTAVAETTPDATAVSPDVVTEGSQSLLLEASDQANAGAVPFSGTVDWTRGVDELGQPTLEAKADIPARNMSVSLLIRKNSDVSLPASHLIEIDFSVNDSFIGGGIARVAGILMKNEELVQGVPLVGASARIVGNNFLFALSASRQDVTANSALLKSRKWMDLAIIY